MFFEKWSSGAAWYRSRWPDELADYLGDDLPNFTTTHRSVEQRVVEIQRYLDQ